MSGQVPQYHLGIVWTIQMKNGDGDYVTFTLPFTNVQAEKPTAFITKEIICKSSYRRIKKKP